MNKPKIILLHSHVNGSGLSNIAATLVRKIKKMLVVTSSVYSILVYKKSNVRSSAYLHNELSIELIDKIIKKNSKYKYIFFDVSGYMEEKTLEYLYKITNLVIYPIHLNYLMDKLLEDISKLSSKLKFTLKFVLCNYKPHISTVGKADKEQKIKELDKYVHNNKLGLLKNNFNYHKNIDDYKKILDNKSNKPTILEILEIVQNV